MSREKYSEKEKEMVMMILERSESTAPVELSFGFTTDSRHINGVVLKKAPSAILGMLVKEGYMLHLDEDGVHVVVL